MRDDLDPEFFQRLLATRHADVERELAAQRQEGAPVELDQTRVGRLSRMDAMQQQAMARAAARRTELELQRLRSALDRLRAGEYGYCVKCEEEIAAGRLRADPATLLCIDCARAAEKR